ncbi:hypothetical protein DICPUDRAFT_75728 [Dictyostelium purpureum]|uniref:Proteasome assembly chaperone 4 n=1 Tax=Dictyostelium purpureum TaxID=5786 RepID=F0ZBI0_DICPU|nr:uncharacterized protein DICPUDRAFT_75728 [Dictyostelium purpureum]EGC38699.1 hypothetical protein DICPUDRAFT_75728 [Dictyostelium purpureum]|eukprot:XP_003284795.1 hypothetical protein DICPUDRAFT_75728 [Dictyostelium purpureum]
MESLSISDNIEDSQPHLKIEKFIDIYEDTKLYFMFYIFQNPNSPLFIWVSDQPNLNTLSVSMKIPMEKLPVTSELIDSSFGISKDSSMSLAQRIVIKFKVQTFLSINISQELPEMTHYIEKKIFELLSQYIPK